MTTNAFSLFPEPYEDDYVDTDAEVAQYQVFFAMFILLMIQNGN